jgi:hypothetical protein
MSSSPTNPSVAVLCYGPLAPRGRQPRTSFPLLAAISDRVADDCVHFPLQLLAFGKPTMPCHKLICEETTQPA